MRLSVSGLKQRKLNWITVPLDARKTSVDNYEFFYIFRKINVIQYWLNKNMLSSSILNNEIYRVHCSDRNNKRGI